MKRGPTTRRRKKESQATPEGDAPKAQDASGDASGASKHDHESSSKEPENTDQKQDASASSNDPVTKKKTESVSETHEDWFIRVTKEETGSLVASKGFSEVSHTLDRSKVIRTLRVLIP